MFSALASPSARRQPSWSFSGVSSSNEKVAGALRGVSKHFKKRIQEGMRFCLMHGVLVEFYEHIQKQCNVPKWAHLVLVAPTGDSGKLEKRNGHQTCIPELSIQTNDCRLVSAEFISDT